MPKRDFTQIAKAIVDKVTGAAPPEKSDTRNPHAVALNQLGAVKGGNARARKLSHKKRVEIARKAARIRWRRAKRKE